MSEMIDRVAKAIYASFYDEALWPPEPFDDGLRTADSYRDAARAALAATWQDASTTPPDKDGFYLCWCDTPPQSHPAQAMRFKDGRWLTSWPIRYWHELDRPE